MAKRGEIVGNRIVLFGSVLYLLEWVAIIPAGEIGPIDPGTKTPQAIFDIYAAHPNAVGFLASWLSLVLLGRIVLMVGLRVALRTAGRDSPVIELAVWAMAVSVIIEVVGYAVVGGGAAIASRGGSVDVVNALDAGAAVITRMIWAPLGVAVCLGGLAMLRSALFPTWISWLGIAGGVILTIGGVVSGAGYMDSGALRGLSTAVMVGSSVFWLWMLSTGVFLFRRAPGKAVTHPSRVA